MLEWTWVPVAYLMGSIPFGLVLARVFCKTDPQSAGSGNIGATNVTRLCGLPVGIATLLFDAGKGALALYLGLRLFTPAAGTDGMDEPGALALFITLVGLAVILGHMHSIFLKFKGGKAVATTLGVFLFLVPVQTLIAAALCIAIIAWKKYVSLGSLVLVLSLPVVIFLSGRTDLLVLSLAAAFFVANAHKPNIRRLLKGEEKPWRKQKEEE